MTIGCNGTENSIKFLQLLFKQLKIKNFDDEKLVHLYQKEGQMVYLDELFGRYIRFVYLICMKYLKEDEKAKDMSMQVLKN
ncbi:MAG: hypothetical protein HC906_09340 [Bacteroidales bacterium]|nr:hypothetical protein [Bacteroidales bacterium]